MSIDLIVVISLRITSQYEKHQGSLCGLLMLRCYRWQSVEQSQSDCCPGGVLIQTRRMIFYFPRVIAMGTRARSGWTALSSKHCRRSTWVWFGCSSFGRLARPSKRAETLTVQCDVRLSSEGSYCVAIACMSLPMESIRECMGMSEWLGKESI